MNEDETDHVYDTLKDKDVELQEEIVGDNKFCLNGGDV